MVPYVIYRGLIVYAAWCKGGVKGTRYSAAKSGWFDTVMFTDWFKNLFLPAVRRKDKGKIEFKRIKYSGAEPKLLVSAPFLTSAW
jgi:hypothetical protein